MTSLILGSSSSARAQQLNQLGLTFKQRPPNIHESHQPNESPREMALRLAHDKNNAIQRPERPSIIVTGDLVIEQDGLILGKPITHKRAIEQLNRCSGKLVTAYSAMVVFCTHLNKTFEYCIETKIKFRKLNLPTIEYYLKTDRPYHCAGSIKVESKGLWLIQKLESNDPSAIIGLPVLSLIETLETLNLLDQFLMNTQPI